MAWEIPGIKISIKTITNLSTKQFFFVKMSAAGNVELAAATTDKVIGILQNKPVSGQTAEIMVNGLSKAKGAAGLNELDLVGSDSSGLAATNSSAGEYLVGQVVKATANANELATIAFDCSNPTRIYSHTT